MRISCWITKDTDTHTEYVILISFSLKQWLREGASLLRYTFIAFLVEKWQYLSTMIFLFLLQRVADISGGGVGWQKCSVSAVHKCYSDPHSCAFVVWKELNSRLRLSTNMSECVHSLFCLADMASEVKCVCSGNYRTKGQANGLLRLVQQRRYHCVEAGWNVIAHAQEPDFVIRRNGRVHLKRRGASVQTTTGSRGVRISGSNAGYTMFRGSVKGIGYPLHLNQ